MKKETLSFDIFFNRDPLNGLPDRWTGAEPGARWLLKKKSATLTGCVGQAPAEEDIQVFPVVQATDGVSTELRASIFGHNDVGGPHGFDSSVELGKLVGSTYQRTAVDLSALLPSGPLIASYPISASWNPVLSKFVVIFITYTYEWVPDNGWAAGGYWSTSYINGAVGKAISVTTAGVAADVTAMFAGAGDWWWKATSGPSFSLAAYAAQPIVSNKGGGHYYIFPSYNEAYVYNVNTQALVTVPTMGPTTTASQCCLMATGDVARIKSGFLQIINPVTGGATLGAVPVGDSGYPSIAHLSGPNRLVVVSGDGVLRYYDGVTGALQATVSTGFPNTGNAYGDVLTVINATDFVVHRPAGLLPLRLRRFSNTTPVTGVVITTNNENPIQRFSVMYSSAGGGFLQLMRGSAPAFSRTDPELRSPTTLLPLSGITVNPFGLFQTDAIPAFVALCPAMFFPPPSVDSPVINLAVLTSSFDGGNYGGGTPNGAFFFTVGDGQGKSFRVTNANVVRNLDTSCVLTAPGVSLAFSGNE